MGTAQSRAGGETDRRLRRAGRSRGNTLRALIKHLDGIGDDEIAGLEMPNGVPLLYDLDPGMRPLARGGRRLAD
jgi:hypothetical protein